MRTAYFQVREKLQVLFYLSKTHLPLLLLLLLSFCQVPFEQALDLIRTRRAFLTRGQVYVPQQDMLPIIVGTFRMRLSAALAVGLCNRLAFCRFTSVAKRPTPFFNSYLVHGASFATVGGRRPTAAHAQYSQVRVGERQCDASQANVRSYRNFVEHTAAASKQYLGKTYNAGTSSTMEVTPDAIPKVSHKIRLTEIALFSDRFHFFFFLTPSWRRSPSLCACAPCKRRCSRSTT